MKFTKSTQSNTVKEEILEVARSVAQGKLDPKLANSSVGAYRTLFQAVRLELIVKQASKRPLPVTKRKK